MVHYAPSPTPHEVEIPPSSRTRCGRYTATSPLVEADADTSLTLPDAYAVKNESFRVTIRPSNGAILALERSKHSCANEYMVFDR
jgi:hypothetical protein